MVLPWIAPSPTTSCYINGTKLYEKSLLSCHKMNGSAFALLHLGLRHCLTIFQPSYSCRTRWSVVTERMPYTRARLPSPKEVRRMETSYRPLISQLITRDSPLHDGKCGKHSVVSPSSRVSVDPNESLLCQSTSPIGGSSLLGVTYNILIHSRLRRV